MLEAGSQTSLLPHFDCISHAHVPSEGISSPHMQPYSVSSPCSQHTSPQNGVARQTQGYEGENGSRQIQPKPKPI